MKLIQCDCLQKVSVTKYYRFGDDIPFTKKVKTRKRKINKLEITLM